MEVQSYHRMPPQYALQAQALQAACDAFDGTCWDLASFSLFNLYPAMPAFFLAFERGALIGVLQLRADETDNAESVCLVLPTARHRGVFTALLARASAALVRFGYRHVLLCRGRAYAQKHPLPGHLHALPAGRTLCLSRPAGLCEGAGSVRLAQCGDVPRLAQIGCDAFAESAEKSMRYIRRTMDGADAALYLLEHGGLPAACVCAARSACGYELYGVCVRGDLRGQGFARAAVAGVLSRLAQAGGEVGLRVALSNRPAQAVFRSCGFERRCEQEAYRIRLPG